MANPMIPRPVQQKIWFNFGLVVGFAIGVLLGFALAHGLAYVGWFGL